MARVGLLLAWPLSQSCAAHTIIEPGDEIPEALFPGESIQQHRALCGSDIEILRGCIKDDNDH